MSTTWTNENLNDYLDNRLNPDDRAKLESIIRKDAVAIDALRELRRMRVNLRKAPRFQLNKDFAARVVASLDKAVDQPALEQVTDTSISDSVVALASPVSASSVSASTWRAIAIGMTAIAASLVLIILIRPPISDGSSVARTPGENAGSQNSGSNSFTNPGSEKGTNGATAGSVAERGGSSEGNVSDSSANQDGDEVPSVEEPRDDKGDRPANENVSADESSIRSADGQANKVADNVDVTQSPARSIPGSDDPTVPDSNSPQESTGPESIAQDFNVQDQKELENDRAQLPEVAPPFQFDEVVILKTTQNQMDTMLGVLSVDLPIHNRVEDFPAPDRSLHSKAQEGLGGGKALEESGNNPTDVVYSVDMGDSTLVMSVEATPEQLDDFLAQFGSPASRIVEQLPKQSLSIDELLALNDNRPDSSASRGAGMSPGGNMQNSDAEKLAITVLGGEFLSQQHSGKSPVPAKPEKVDSEDTPSQPAVRRYLIVVKAEESQ